MIKIFLMLVWVFTSLDLWSEEEKNDKPIKIGNLAVPSSQQPGPLISFGQNIVNQGDTQAFLLSVNFAKEKGDYSINFVPSLLYAFTDDLTIFLNVPFSTRSKQDHTHTCGFQDLFVQLEYAFYTKEDESSINQATLVGYVSFPSGSARKNPPTGDGSPSFFLGTTFLRMTTDWFYFTSEGCILTTSHHHTQTGNQFLYQLGLGKNIANFFDWLFCWMVELDGTYSTKDKIHGQKNRDSGGNFILLTPSLWISGKHLILQLGVGFPIQQSLYGHQSKYRALYVANLGWTF